MYNNLIKIVPVLLFVLCSLRLGAQSGFITKFDTTEDEGLNLFLENSNNDFIGFIGRECIETLVWSNYLYNINSTGDTMFSRLFEKVDTTLFFGNIVQSSINPIEYLITGKGYKNSDTITHLFTIFIKIDSSFNTIWERTYQLRPLNNINYEISAQLLKKKDSGYFYATNIENDYLYTLILFVLSEDGDSLAYRTYEGDSAGIRLMDVIYNHDSSSYLLFTDYAHGNPTMGAECITVDFDLNQTDVFHYPTFFNDGLTGKLLPNGELLTGALYENVEDFYNKYSNMAVYKYDTSFNLLAECYVADPSYDIRKDHGDRTIDYYYPNSIFVAGTFDYDVGIWIPHPSWIVIGKMDSNLNLLTERYIGGDAYYRFCNLTATSDGGLLITAMRYDYLTQNYEHDAYIFKFDSLDLTVGINENISKKLANAIVYPNPASDYLYIRTSIKNIEFVLHDMAGNKLLKFPIDNLITKKTLDNIPPGTYVWSIYQQSKLIETGKIIITI